MLQCRAPQRNCGNISAGAQIFILLYIERDVADRVISPAMLRTLHGLYRALLTGHVVVGSVFISVVFVMQNVTIPSLSDSSPLFPGKKTADPVLPLLRPCSFLNAVAFCRFVCAILRIIGAQEALATLN